MGPIIRRLSSLGIVIGLAVVVTACGSSSRSTTSPGLATAYTSTYPSTPVAPAEVVARVGSATITGSLYDHWLAILSAKVKPSGIGARPGKPFKLDPPNFTACIALLKAGVPKFSASELKPTCVREYTKVKSSTLELLITRYWVREAAAEAKILLSQAEVERRFLQARKENFPAPGALLKYQEETLQSTQDLLFSVRSKLLAKLLLANFKKAHGKGRSESEITTAYEASIFKWKTKTFCEPGYVVKLCSQYAAASKPRSS
jgi:hypothetical protein